MSEENTKKYYHAVGVIKFDHLHAGYPDVRKIAEEWAKDPSFYEVTVRFVSEKNFGIQFVYICEDEGERSFNVKYFDPLKQRFGREGLYAYDVEERGDYSIDDLKTRFIVLRGIEFLN